MKNKISNNLQKLFLIQFFIGILIFIFSLFDQSIENPFFLVYSLEKFILIIFQLFLIFICIWLYKKKNWLNKIDLILQRIKNNATLNLIFFLSSLTLLFFPIWMHTYKGLFSYWYYYNKLSYLIIWAILFLFHISIYNLFDQLTSISTLLKTNIKNILLTIIATAFLYIIFGGARLSIDQQNIYTLASPYSILTTNIYIIFSTIFITIFSKSDKKIQSSNNNHFKILVLSFISIISLGQILRFSESNFSHWDNAIKFFHYKPIIYIVLVFSINLFSFYFYQSLKLEKSTKSNKNLFKFLIGGTVVYIIFNLLFKLAGFVTTPDIKFWNGAGNPIYFYQICIAILTILIVYFFLSFFKNKSINPNFYTIFILAFIIVFAIVTWQWQPDSKNYFFTKPVAPNFEKYPYSDSQDFDYGGQFIRYGEYINNGFTTVNMFEMFLTYIYHLFAGQNYTLTSQIQMGLMILLPIGIFLLGKKLKYPQIGLIAAILTIYQEGNAIKLSGVISNVHIQTLMSEIPTLLFLVWGALFFVAFIKDKRIIDGLLSSVILGLSMLLRLNTIFVFAFFTIYLFLFVIYNKKYDWKHLWQFFLPGFLIFSSWQYVTYKISGTLRLYDKVYEVILRTISISPASTIKNGLIVNPIFNYIEETISTLYALINHFFNNLFTSFMVLPMNFFWHNPSLDFEFWDPINKWTGTLTVSQWILITINFFILVIGLWYLWKRNKKTVFIPLLLLLSYSISLGIARTSGGRYLTPFNWVIVFYYASGIWFILTKIIPPIKDIKFPTQENSSNASLKTISLVFLILLYLSMIFTPILIPDYNFKQQAELMPIMSEIYENKNLEQANLTDLLNQPNIVLSEGFALYSRFNSSNQLIGKMINPYIRSFESPQVSNIENYELPHDTQIIFIGETKYDSIILLEYAFLDQNNQWQFYTFDQ